MIATNDIVPSCMHRPLKGLTEQHHSFSPTQLSIAFIAALGSTPTFGYHNTIVGVGALPIIKKMVREAPEPLNEQLVQGYYEQIGFDAYQRAHYILTGREKFARTKCPCVACSMKRMEEE